VEAEQDFQVFWSTPLLAIHHVLNGVAKRLKREHNDRAWAAWHTAYLTAYAPKKSKEFTKLKSLLHGSDGPSKKHSPEHIEAIVRSWMDGRKRKKPQVKM